MQCIGGGYQARLDAVPAQVDRREPGGRELSVGEHDVVARPPVDGLDRDVQSPRGAGEKRDVGRGNGQQLSAELPAVALDLNACIASGGTE